MLPVRLLGRVGVGDVRLADDRAVTSDVDPLDHDGVGERTVMPM